MINYDNLATCDISVLYSGNRSISAGERKLVQNAIYQSDNVWVWSLYKETRVKMGTCHNLFTMSHVLVFALYRFATLLQFDTWPRWQFSKTRLVCSKLLFWKALYRTLLRDEGREISPQATVRRSLASPLEPQVWFGKIDFPDLN